MNEYSFNASSGVKREPFRATRMWNEVVEYTKEHVEIKSHTVKRQTYHKCFTGADVVDIVFHHLRAERSNRSCTLSRENAVKICQLFLDLKIMSCVQSERSALWSFEDSCMALYHFTSDDRIENTKLVKLEISSENDTSSCIWNSQSNRLGREIARISDAIGWSHSRFSACAPLTPTNCNNQSLSLSVMGSSQLSCFEREIANEVMLNSMLELIEIPVLDDILQYISSTIGSDVGKGSIPFELSSSTLLDEDDWCKQDGWWLAARACASSLPGDVGINLVKTSLTEASSELQKIRFFHCLADWFTTSGSSLWPSAFADIHLGLFRLLMESRGLDALRVLQLSFSMMSTADQNRLHKLLMFLREASSVDAVQLSVLDVNHEVIEHTFSDIFISNQLLTRHQTGQILSFTMSNVSVLCDLPPDVQDVIDVRCGRTSVHSAVGKIGQAVGSADISSGNVSALLVDSTEKSYCKRVSAEEYRSQSLDLTDRALVDMINSMLNNTRVPLKEKKRHLKQFMKHHPRLGLLHFSDVA